MIPTTSHYWLRNARVPLAVLQESDRPLLPVIAHLARPPLQEEWVAADLELYEGYIRQIQPTVAPPALEPGSGGEPSIPSIDLQESIILPGFVDAHTHLDKGHSWTRTPNPDGTFASALDGAEQDKQHWTVDDLYQRMDFGVRCSYAQGTVALRTHLDLFENTIEASIEAFQQLQAEWRDRVTLQAVALVTLEQYLSPFGDRIVAAMEQVNGLLGGVPLMHPQLDEQLDRVFSLAKERGIPLDFHTDETNDPTSLTLRHVAIAALRHEFPYLILCGHCCNLSVQSQDEASKTMAVVKEAGIHIVSLPMCNLYLQDRQAARTPRWRGVTLLQELQQQGIPVAIANDNCRDVFFAYGNHDGLEVLTQSVRIGQLDRPIGSWTRAITSTPAQSLGLPHLGQIGRGRRADLVIFRARNVSELLSRPQSDRTVIRGGQAIDTQLPSYASLDHLVPH